MYYIVHPNFAKVCWQLSGKDTLTGRNFDNPLPRQAFPGDISEIVLKFPGHVANLAGFGQITKINRMPGADNLMVKISGL